MLKYWFAAAVAAVAACPSKAATIVQSYNGLAPFSQFNSTLGLLNSVMLTIEFDYRITVRAFEPETFRLLGTFGFPEEGVIAVDTFVTTQAINPEAQQARLTDGLSNTFDSNLARFIGTGILFFGNSFDIVATRADGSVVTSDFFPGGGSAPGGATLTYSFTPFVPEPSSWGLMLAGFGMIGYALRKRPAVTYAI